MGDEKMNDRKITNFFLSILVVLALSGCSSGESNTTANSEHTDDLSTDVEEAERIYTFSCANCHGTDLSGKVAPSLLQIGDRLSEEEIKTIIIEGVGTMPRGLVNEEEAEIVAKWLVERE